MSDQEKMATVLLLSGYARDVGRITSSLARAIQSGTPVGAVTGRSYADAFKELVTAERFPDLFPVVQSGAYIEDEDTPEADDFGFGLERVLDGIQHFLDTRGSGGTPVEPPEKVEPYPTKDKAVREAMKARREAEAKLREAVKREKELVARAREREQRRG